MTLSHLTALLGGFVLSESVRLLNHYGYHYDLFNPLENRSGLATCVLMGFFAGEIWEESSPLLASVAFSVTFASCGVLFDALFRSTQRSPFSQPQHQNSCYRTADAAECREIIKSGTGPTAPRNTLSALEARARPNQRLKLAFGIDSCFTSSDERSCKSFRASVEKLLYVDEKEWVNFAATARDTAKEALDGSNGDTASLFAVVQLLTLKTMMRALWPDRDSKQSTNEQISALAHEVNMQWLRSKECTSNDNPSWLFSKQTSLKDAVKAVFPDWDEENSNENPCNLILPGYETMWRVVLRCFVEIKARNHPHAMLWNYALWNFLQQPTKHALQRPLIEVQKRLAAIHIAQEVLRLYPPTRRIYREHRSTDGQKTTVSADIEAMQRDPTIWHDQPNIFKPERWIGIEDGYAKGYMPFGASPFNCPAKRWKNVPMPFGLSMIALLVAALLETTDKWRVQGELPERHYPLDTDREAYSTAVLQRF